jgi:hypothetical protein
VRAYADAQIQQLVRQGRLVALGDSTPHWVLRKMDHSVPYVTPDARALLAAGGAPLPRAPRQPRNPALPDEGDLRAAHRLHPGGAAKDQLLRVADGERARVRHHDGRVARALRRFRPGRGPRRTRSRRWGRSTQRSSRASWGAP